MTRRLHLVRHGEVHNPEHVVYGTLPGFVLSAAGRAHAQAAGRRLRELVSGPPCIVSSPLERAQETAAIIARTFGEDVNVTTDERLIEARSFAMGLPRRFAPHLYLRRMLQTNRPRNESPTAIVDRMVEAARAACGPHPDAILVSHQFPIWMARLGLENGHENGLAQHARAFVARRAPFLFLRERCVPGSITTILLDDPRPHTTTYWEPC